MNTVFSREEYLQRIKEEKTAVRLWQISLVTAFLVLWELAAQKGVIDAFIVSSPSRIVSTFFTMYNAGLFLHIGCTLAETIAGFFIGVAVGFMLAVGLWFSPFAGKVFAPYLAVLNSLPKIALGPVIIVWVGAGVQAVITMAVAISLIVTVMELSVGFNATDKNLLITVESFGAGKRESFLKIVLPYNIPTLFQSLKINMGLSFVGVIAGEFLVSKAGLGYLIVYAGQVFKMDLVMMSVVLLGIIAFAIYSAINLCQKLVIKMMNHI